MSTAVMMEQIPKASLQFKARMAGLFYLFTFLTGGYALFVGGRLGVAAGLIAGACYIAVTLLFLLHLQAGEQEPLFALGSSQPRGMRHWAS